VEVGSKAQLLDKFTLYGNYTYTKGTFEQDPFKGNDIPAVPRHKANVGFRIHEIAPDLTFSADYNFIGPSYAISDQGNEFDKLEAYHTINARLSYERKSLKAFVGVNNLTDEEYSEYAIIGGSPRGRNFHPAPERNWLAGLELVF
jgi:iron complex outermembrane receptor protein